MRRVLANPVRDRGAIRRWGLIACVLLAAVACTPRQVQSQCEYASDCPSGLVCIDRRCRSECAATRDCPDGSVCRAGVETALQSCVPDDMAAPCATNAECQPVGVCAGDGVCRARCASAVDCTAAGAGGECRMHDATCARALTAEQIRAGRIDAGVDVGACDAGECGGRCVDLSSDPANCGSCGTVCMGPCRAGRCRALNDTCASAQSVTLSDRDLTLNLVANLRDALHDLDAPCATDRGGPDVFFSFTLGAPEMVYADTFGSSVDTVLFFATRCDAANPSGSTPDEAVCNDDASTRGCASGATQSQIIARLAPGRHFLVVSMRGDISAAQTVNVRLQHLPAGNGPAALIRTGTHIYAGSTSGTGLVVPPPLGCPAAEGLGPENIYWFTTCPEAPFSRGFSASTCGGATWNTVLYARNAEDPIVVCNNDFPTCGMQSRIPTANVVAGAGLHALWIDGFAAGSMGSYMLEITRP